MPDIKKVVLAYSGGLDTSVILKWLQDTYRCEVVTFTADIGQGEEVLPARQKALQLGILEKNIYVEDLREEFVRDFVYPMFRANAVYEGEYLLGTSIARPLIAKRLIEIARKTRADAVSHGATGKGNDQVRFELGAYALEPNIKVIAPWREWDLLSREKLLAYADKHRIPVDFKKRKGGAPYSMDANLLHISYEGGILEDPDYAPEESMWRITVSPEKAPAKPQVVELEYRHGDIVAVDGGKLTPAAALAKLNELGGRHGIGRLDIVENRYVGMKSRGCYETPGRHDHAEGPPGDGIDHARSRGAGAEGRPDAALRPHDLQRLLVQPRAQAPAGPDRRVAGDGQRHGPAEALQGTIMCVGRASKSDSLFDPAISTFEDDAGAYDQKDAAGFIRLNALRLRIAANLARRKVR